MAGYATGKATFIGTGSKTLITNLTGAPTGCRVTCADSGGNNICIGTSDGTRQNVQATNDVGSNSKIMLLTDGVSTLQEATWTSFGTSGSAGTVVFNVTTNGSYSFTLEAWN